MQLTHLMKKNLKEKTQEGLIEFHNFMHIHLQLLFGKCIFFNGNNIHVVRF